MIPPLRFNALVYAATIILVLAAGSQAQVITNTSDGALSASIPFANLTPGRSTTPSSTQIQFRLRDSNNAGYHVEASAVFSATTSSAVAGGATIAASDIGIGITSITYGSSVITPRTDSITAGLNYDPGSVIATNGLTPYTGIGSGKATLADIIANPSIKILSGPRIASNESTSTPNNAITVTITFGLLGQFFTPATFSGTLTLTIKNGQ